jgi:hypothetical protein
MAQRELPKAQPMGEPVNCTSYELSTYLQALAAGYLATSCLDTNPSAPLKSNPIASKSYTQGNKTVYFRGFPYLRMSKSLTASHGAASLTLCAEGSPVRTLAQPGKAQDWKVKEAAFGQICGVSLAKYDPVTHSLKTPQCLLFEDSTESLLTLPHWGWMRDGECFAAVSTACCTTENESSFWPTPQRIDEDFCRMTVESSSRVGHQIQVTTELIRRNGKRYPLPSFAEALMNWPPGYSRAGKPLATDRFLRWLLSHGKP